MGQVYRARDARLGREVAIKVLHDDHAQDPDWLLRFEREARLLAALSHGNIATVHGLDEVGGVRYLVMELVPGQTLAQRLAEGPLPLDEALAICKQIAEALEAAHERGIIHRDLKPANVMITPEGKVKVLDFGLARSTGPLAGPAAPTTPYHHTTREGMIQGTAAYMPPEQARGKSLDKRCDVWSFGCVLFEVITGKQVFAGETLSDVLAAVLHDSPDWQALPPGLPPRIEALLRRCLQKDAQKRLRDIGDARLEIEETLTDLSRPPEPGRGRATTAVPARRRWPRRVAAILAVAAALGVGVIAGMLAQSRRPGPSAGAEESAPPGWSGQVLLAGTTRAFGPRVSPDGQWLAFIALHEGQAQVGVMKLASGEWWVLTRARKRGSVGGICWSADSTQLYFDRFVEKPMGVFSVSPLDISPKGARERLVLADADCPQVTADGSLVVCKLDEAGNYRLYRSDRPDEAVSPSIEFNIGWPSPVRPLWKRNRVVFCGKVFDGTEALPKRRFYLLDLDTMAF
jgi:hypothetical protein